MITVPITITITNETMLMVARAQGLGLGSELLASRMDFSNVGNHSPLWVNCLSLVRAALGSDCPDPDQDLEECEVETSDH